MSSSCSLTQPSDASGIQSEHLRICQHSVVQHHLAILRNKHTSVEDFRRSISQIGRYLMMDASRDLPLAPIQVETPITTTTCYQLVKDVPLLLVPILRAGLGLAEPALDVLPMARVCHLGMARDEETFKPVTYYHKLPDVFSYDKARVFITDPMLATGGSAVAAVDLLKKQGALGKYIHFVCVLAAPEGVKKLLECHPDITVHTASVDERLNERSYIVPGLGDAGDRTFGTL